VRLLHHQARDLKDYHNCPVREPCEAQHEGIYGEDHKVASHSCPLKVFQATGSANARLGDPEVTRSFGFLEIGLTGKNGLTDPNINI
jgi:hypothetical protein